MLLLPPGTLLALREGGVDLATLASGNDPSEIFVGHEINLRVVLALQAEAEMERAARLQEIAEGHNPLLAALSRSLRNAEQEGRTADAQEAAEHVRNRLEALAGDPTLVAKLEADATYQAAQEEVASLNRVDDLRKRDTQDFLVDHAADIDPAQVEHVAHNAARGAIYARLEKLGVEDPHTLSPERLALNIQTLSGIAAEGLDDSLALEMQGPGATLENLGPAVPDVQPIVAQNVMPAAPGVH